MQIYNKNLKIVSFLIIYLCQSIETGWYPIKSTTRELKIRRLAETPCGFWAIGRLTAPCRPRQQASRQSEGVSRSGGLHEVQCWLTRSSRRRRQSRRRCNTCIPCGCRYFCRYGNRSDSCWLEKPIPPAFLQALPCMSVCVWTCRTVLEKGIWR